MKQVSVVIYHLLIILGHSLPLEVTFSLREPSLSVGTKLRA